MWHGDLKMAACSSEDSLPPNAGDSGSSEGRTFSPEGVDLTLIRWMLSMSPAERLAALQGAVDSIVRLQKAQDVA